MMAVPAIVAPPAKGPAPAGNDALVQRAYEWALQVGNKAVWDTFIANYPSGLYTELAKAQRDKVVSEAARLAATEKARAAQEEQTHLADAGAKKAEIAKAAAEAKKAEQQRIAAERAKKAEDAKVAEAEKAKAAAKVRGTWGRERNGMDMKARERFGRRWSSANGNWICKFKL